MDEGVVISDCGWVELWGRFEKLHHEGDLSGSIPVLNDLVQQSLHEQNRYRY